MPKVKCLTKEVRTWLGAVFFSFCCAASKCPPFVQYLPCFAPITFIFFYQGASHLYSILTNYSPKGLGCSVPHPGTRILENFHSVNGSLLPRSHVIMWKIFPLLGTVCFIERSHLHVSNLIVVDAVDIKGHNKEEILNINTIRTPYFFFGETE